MEQYKLNAGQRATVINYAFNTHDLFPNETAAKYAFNVLEEVMTEYFIGMDLNVYDKGVMESLLFNELMKYIVHVSSKIEDVKKFAKLIIQGE